jgi:hypothetical protein
MSCITLCIPKRIDAPPPIGTGIASGRLRLQRRCSQAVNHACAISLVAMGLLIELGVEDPVPPLDAPPVSRQLHEAFWGCAEAREMEVVGVERSAVVRFYGGLLNDSTRADPLLTDMLWRPFLS